ncbi:MCE family protein [Gordonia sp. (in: high G+C Gram-positive bacteria)]|uniref:MCE family protein n=1 Tax=Gordonia sp. (in: high G+C Gram-positive bacteria) TaxID=84139 RepID=UPI002622521C|nr:MCE family protein [Gordonia sp. (in: high G+C Gram-positive bacteria)]
MTVMLPGRPVSRRSYVLRALVATALIVAFSLWMIARSTGTLSSDPTVYADVPESVGLIQPGAPVRYHGIKVGEITSIEAGTRSSRIEVTVGHDLLSRIPRSVSVRVLPRTFFGDIYLQLVPAEGTSTARSGSLTPGSVLGVDDGPDAVNLYGIFTELSGLIAEVRPDQLNVALAAVDKAIGGRGDQIGVMIDDWWAASRELESSVNAFLSATPTFRRVAESLRRATPDILETISSVTNISRGIADHGGQLGVFLTAASGFVSASGSFLAEQRKNLITVLDSTGKILSTVAANPSGITRTVLEADKFGAAGTILFSTGRFDITAVPTFSQPMPYTAADCPRYGSLRGAQCFGTGTGVGTGPVRGPGERGGTVLHPRKPVTAEPSSYTGPEVIDGAAEAPGLHAIEGAVRPASTSRDGAPNPATVYMLGPMVRGSEVHLS